MSEKILVPVLGESITEATVAKWLKNTGDTVEADEPIVELETDKVNLEVPSPVKGILTEINSKEGSTVEIGALLGLVSENGATTSSVKEQEEEIKKIEPTSKENNVIKNAPHTCQMVSISEWNYPYSREEAAFPTGNFEDKCSKRALAIPRFPSEFSKSIGLTLCGIAEDPTSFLFIFCLK